MTVLLVEDNTIVRLTLIEILEDVGLEVLDAGDAEEALAILKDPSRRIRVLVTDLDLGAGDDGLVLAVKARKGLPNLQIVYVTGSPERFAGHHFSPWETVFLKPFDPIALVKAILASSKANVRQRRLQLFLAEEAAEHSL